MSIRDDGLTADNMGLFMRNPRGHLLALKSDFSLHSNSLKRKMAIIGMYYQVGKRLDISTSVLASDLGIPQMCFSAIWTYARYYRQGKKNEELI